MRNRALGMVFVLLAAAACPGGPIIKTESTMRDWAEVLKLFFASGYGNGPEFPHSLGDLKDFPGGRPSPADGWGHPITYRLVSMDRYQLISRGPDGVLGNDDDIVVENGIQVEAKKAYAGNPVREGS